MQPSRTTRLAPSPTGALHLGNARTFLINWLLARQQGWRIILRIEDLDGPRIKAGADRGLIDDLQWLGLDWDDGPVYQSARREQYAEAIARLVKNGDVYPCICTRKEIEASASAPHPEDGSAVYPGTCRGRFASIEAARAATGRAPALRFRVPNERLAFDDTIQGRVEYDLATAGDFVVAKGDSTPAYQLAVVMDDAAMDISDVVRGDDLLDSTPRQILIYDALKCGAQIPRYWHVPLVIGPDGRRLAKRHGDTRLAFYREQGVPAERLLALLARWCGIDATEAITAREMIERFDADRLPRSPITFADHDDRWLRHRHAAAPIGNRPAPPDTQRPA